MDAPVFDPSLKSQFHSGLWSVFEHVKTPPRPKDPAKKPKSEPKMVTTIKYAGSIVFETTGVTAFASAEERVKKWIADGHEPKITAGKCMADIGAGSRISTALKDGRKNSPSLIEALL